MAHWHISVDDPGWSSALPNLDDICETTADAALRAGLSAADTPFDIAVGHDRLETSLCFMSDAEMQALNRDHRGKDQPTNVLSFAAFEDPQLVLPPAGPVLLGDIVLARETIVREAQEQSKSLADHTKHMITHGVLHLLGYDHESATDAVVMEDLEREILSSLGVADPYAAADA